MSKYMITNPSFSEFRAGEPKAYRLAARAVETSGRDTFEIKYAGEGTVVGEKTKVTVYLETINDPFEFEMMKI